MASDIQFWDRKSQSYQMEKVYGDAAVKWSYGSTLGRGITENLLIRPWISKLYGDLQSRPSSAKKVQPFIQSFNIDMSEYEEGPFATFNDFFIRKFRDGKRKFPANPHEVGAFAEARYFAYESTQAPHSLYIKGDRYSLERLLGSADLAQEFHDGPLWIARLCPVDYHRFHYPTDGQVTHWQRLPGKLHSVNPAALKVIPGLLGENERHLTLIETLHHGLLAYLEVGALMVGKIVQSHCEKDQKYAAGQEKGYFLFGASTVVLLGQKGRIRPTTDLVAQTQKGFETRVLLGEKIADMG